MTDTFELITAQRLRVAEYFESLESAQFDVASLCHGWSVHDVLAHLTMPFELSLATMIRRMVLAGGNFDKVSNNFVASRRTTAVADMIATLRANAESRFTPPGTGPGGPLTDITVHGLDVALPTGGHLEVPAAVCEAVLDFTMTKAAQGPFVRRGSTAGLTFVATDLQWRSGSGPEVHAPAGLLVLALTGREPGVVALGGEGADEFRRRLAA